jgi:mono/diheme cytochrome c family protein
MLEERRVMSRFGFALVFGCACSTLTMTGCSDAWNAGPMQYVESESLTKDVGKTNLFGKPVLQDKVRAALVGLFGDSPQHIKVPVGSGLPAGGLYLGNLLQEGVGPDAKTYTIYHARSVSSAMKVEASEIGDARRQEGGYAIYRKNCLHCHGVSGAGDGPTAPFLYPLPRDYRKGIFKFTSTASGAKPDRSDLRRTIKNGLHGTSMPAFDALLVESEIEQVIDYVIFLSMRGETELALIEEASISDEKDANALSDEIAKDVANNIFRKWKLAESQVFNPPTPRTPSSRESILRGRDLFLGKTTEKLECAGCHGPLARGDGPSFVSQDIFNEVVFGGNPSERQARLDAYTKQAEELKKEQKAATDKGDNELAASLGEEAEKLVKIRVLWDQKPDDWGNPLRPANLNRGVYKGGRRPIDIFWRVAKGINGAQMPAHYPSPLNEAKVWDVVNFVLALPYEPKLLKDVPAAPATGPAVASSGLGP